MSNQAKPLQATRFSPVSAALAPLSANQAPLLPWSISAPLLPLNSARAARCLVSRASLKRLAEDQSPVVVKRASHHADKENLSK